MSTRRAMQTRNTLRLASEGISKSSSSLAKATGHSRFKALFGVTLDVCVTIWTRIHARVPPGGREKHMLWALLFMKVYGTEPVNRVLTGADEKTFRKWSWTFIRIMADMNEIRWEHRYIRKSGTIMISVDGSDFRIYEPSPFSTKWYSHKFNGPGLRYELGVCISTGHMVWVNGPFPCGTFPDLRIFQLNMKPALDPNEKVVADGGYKDERCKKMGENETVSKFYSIVRARHETLNRRMKQFNILGMRFRHNHKLHSAVFHAIANITQIVIEDSEPLFSIKQ